MARAPSTHGANLAGRAFPPRLNRRCGRPMTRVCSVPIQGWRVPGAAAGRPSAVPPTPMQRWPGSRRPRRRSAADDPGLLLVFAGGTYDLPVLIAAITEIAAGIPLVGCTSAGEIDASGPATGSVVVVALGGEGLTFSVAAVTGATPREAGARVAACVGDVADCPHRVLMLLADGPSAIHADVVRGAYSVSGAGVPLVGGIAGHPSFGRNDEHAVVYGGSVLRDAVVGVAIGSDAPLGIGVRHGWREVGEPLLVTRAEPGRVLELDGRPADEVYRDLLGGGDVPDAVVLGHPLGMQQRVGEAHIRSVGARRRRRRRHSAARRRPARSSGSWRPIARACWPPPTPRAPTPWPRSTAPRPRR